MKKIPSRKAPRKKSAKVARKKVVRAKENGIPLAKKIFLGLALVASLYMFIRCGQPGQNSSTACTPNVIDNGLSLNVSPLGDSAYSFQLCSASNPAAAVYSVYGGASEQDLSNGFNLNAAVRTAHISGENAAGATFQVTFKSSDTEFVIYQDANVGGVDELDNSTSAMVSPHQLPP